jgi:uncharacterized 2Fe-2S/4Fe-4S cluster protein (DUF4445 family)
MSENCKIKFLPVDEEIRVKKGTTILDAALNAGLFIKALCGGAGTCGKCKVIIKEGEAKSDESMGVLGKELYDKGFRLACRTEIDEDLMVEIPEESRADLDGKHLASHSISSPRYAPDVDIEAMGAWFNPALRKYNVVVDPPTKDDNTSDLTRLLRALKRHHNLENISVDFLLLKTLPEKIRKDNWNVTVILVETRVESQLSNTQFRGSRRPKMIQVEPGDRTSYHYSVVFDIGTTTIKSRLLDLNDGKVMATSTVYNPQIKYGPDVITRIVHSLKKGGLDTLQKAVVGGMNEVIDDLIDQTGIERRCISHITAAGNTVMTHLLLGLNNRYIREAPYTPVANFIPPIRAIRIGLNVVDSVYLYTFPSISSYVGGDIVSGVLSSGFYKKKDVTLFIDIGTNGEIVLGNIDWLMTASCSAGPAFEGGGVKCGMHAAPGAIEGFYINPNDFEPMIKTIGKKEPKGICGSGIINVLAELFIAGVLDQDGKIRKKIPSKRIRKGNSGMEYVIAWAENSATGEDIVINEVDIENIMRAKAAMFAGYTSLMEKTGIMLSDIKNVIIAGAFGDFIDLENAIAIGLLPDLPLERFQFVGNASLAGALLISLSNDMLDDGEKIARNMTNLELSEDNRFMDHYMAAMFLPHTDFDSFPTVKEKFEKIGAKEEKISV